ncbi:MAG: glycosyl transferase family 2 [Rhodospirillaceae bacterium]|nr:glycosyl transferase family 2 [Rhodospirillaceae bacterium]
MTISVVIPTLEAGDTLRPTLDSVIASVDEIVVSDGQSLDHTVDQAKQSGAKVVVGERGRGQQLKRGAEAATGDWLLFLHADTVLESCWFDEAQKFIAEEARGAAVFKFALNEKRAMARMIERVVALRCCLFGLPYGDQGLLISRKCYDELGGYKPIPLFEDVDIVRRIGRRRLTFLRSHAVTSAIRYQGGGFIRRPLKNLMLLLLYYLGVSPGTLVHLYK